MHSQSVYLCKNKSSLYVDRQSVHFLYINWGPRNTGKGTMLRTWEPENTAAEQAGTKDGLTGRTHARAGNNVWGH